MYFNSETINATRLAALDHYQSASKILFDSTARLIDLYSHAGSKVLGLARQNESESLPGPTLFKQLVPELLMGHLLVASHAHEDLVRFMGVQIHSTSSLAKFALDKTSQWSPPLTEFAANAAESIIEAGESAADELGDATIRTVAEVERKLERSSRVKKRAAAE